MATGRRALAGYRHIGRPGEEGRLFISCSAKHHREEASFSAEE
jgi:hypothetical protein